MVGSNWVELAVGLLVTAFAAALSGTGIVVAWAARKVLAHDTQIRVTMDRLDRMEQNNQHRHAETQDAISATVTEIHRLWARDAAPSSHGAGRTTRPSDTPAES
jgi:hypothetical protein